MLANGYHNKLRKVCHFFWFRPKFVSMTQFSKFSPFIITASTMTRLKLNIIYMITISISKDPIWLKNCSIKSMLENFDLNLWRSNFQLTLTCNSRPLQNPYIQAIFCLTLSKIGQGPEEKFMSNTEFQSVLL